MPDGTHIQSSLATRCRGADPLRVVFMYLGRGGALGHFMKGLADAAKRIDGLEASFIVSRANAYAHSLQTNASAVLLPTFEGRSAMAATKNFFAARRILKSHLESARPHALINLMPHVWTPFWVPLARKAGISYVTIVHDAVGHPGDPWGLLVPWLHREARAADLVVTLSRHVAGQLRELAVDPPAGIVRLFLPDFSYGEHVIARRAPEGRPLRILFFGRVLEYRGLHVLLDAVELLRAEGCAVQLGVIGLGPIQRHAKRLERLGAEVINRWVEDSEVGPLLAAYDVMALPHVECSQSASAAAAFGAGMPAVGIPVGGLGEQISDGINGMLARQATGRSLADAIRRLATDPALYRRICSNIQSSASERSTSRFLSLLMREVALLQSRRTKTTFLGVDDPAVADLPRYAPAAVRASA